MILSPISPLILSEVEEQVRAQPRTSGQATNSLGFARMAPSTALGTDGFWVFGQHRL